jgi:hypothetical protein
VFIVGTPQAYPCLEFKMYSDIYNQLIIEKLSLCGFLLVKDEA